MAESEQFFSQTPPLRLFLTAALPGAFGMLVSSIYGLMGATGELARQATLYLRVYSVFLPLTSIGFAADNYLRICGRIRRSMWANVLMAASGAAIEFVLLGVLRLGVGAAALSYCVAMLLAVVVSLWPFFRGGMDLSFVSPRFSGELVAQIVTSGLPSFLENVAGRVSSIVLNVALLSLGGEVAISIYGVLMFTDAIIVPLIYGTVDSLQPAVGFNWGARDRMARARRGERGLAQTAKSGQAPAARCLCGVCSNMVPTQPYAKVAMFFNRRAVPTNAQEAPHEHS